MATNSEVCPDVNRRVIHRVDRVLEPLSQMLGATLEFKTRTQAEASDSPWAPILHSGRPTDWVVTVDSDDPTVTRNGLQLAADVLSAHAEVWADVDEMSEKLCQYYDELNFIYDMSSEVGALLDEKKICDFIVQKTAKMLGCERASLMLLDEDTGTLKIYAGVGLPPEIVENTEMRPGEGISGRVLESGEPTIVGAEDRLPEDALRKKELEESDEFLSIPLKMTHEERGPEVIGVINLTRKKGGEMFTSGDQKLIVAAASQIATQIHNCRLLKAERERRELEKELQLAAEIQRKLLPEAPIRTRNLEAAGVCRQARNVGGDFLDYWEHDGRISLLVADVCGHDLGAALLAAELRSVLRSESVHTNSISELLSSAYRTLFDDLCRSDLLITLFCAQIDIEKGLLSFCRAGHPKPLLISSNGRAGDPETRWLETGGPLLGLEADPPFSEETVELKSGDLLLIYSDGILEASDEEGRFFGSEGLQQTALQCLDNEPSTLAREIIDRAQEHLADPIPCDDMTVLAAKYG